MLHNKCALCNVKITAENNTDEHVIPRAIGGRLKVRNFICVSCNNDAGHEWDNKLVAALASFSLMLGIDREGKEVPRQLIETDKGKVWLNYDGTMDKTKPEVNINKNGNKLEINLTARSEEEALKIINGNLRKYGKAEVTSLDGIQGEIEDTTDHSPTLVKAGLTLGDPEMGRIQLEVFNAAYSTLNFRNI